jgi:hypothetical protein
LEEGSRHQLALAQQQVRHVLELAQATPQAAAVAAPPAAPGAPAPAFQQRLQKIVSRSASKALIIRSSQMEPKNLANLEEDLSVMARILDKALAEKLDDDDHRPGRAMGIDVFLTPGAGPIRSLYLEDYGVVFMLNVNFPLLAPPTKPAEEKEKSEADSTWEEAKRELYGQRGGWDAEVGNLLRSGFDPGRGREYDEKKVEDLKQAVLEALKNASNLRNLKADDLITVCVFGSGNVGAERAKAVTRARPEPRPAPGLEEERNEVFVWKQHESGGRARGTTMTIRVRKSDVDAFAKGKLSLDDFRKKATIATYLGEAGGSGGFGGALFGGAP